MVVVTVPTSDDPTSSKQPKLANMPQVPSAEDITSITPSKPDVAMVVDECVATNLNHTSSSPLDIVHMPSEELVAPTTVPKVGVSQGVISGVKIMALPHSSLDVGGIFKQILKTDEDPKKYV